MASEGRRKGKRGGRRAGELDGKKKTGSGIIDKGERERERKTVSEKGGDEASAVGAEG